MEARGLYGAPEIKVVVGDEVHVSVLKALSMLGLGRERLVRVPVDGQGRMRAEALPELDEMSIVCIQAGNVNTGAFDPAADVCAAAHQRRSLGTRRRRFRSLGAGRPDPRPSDSRYLQADSWAADAHKWLNVPYDSGLAFVREPNICGRPCRSARLICSRATSANPATTRPELSRRARGIEVWAALYSLGRSGLADLISAQLPLRGPFCGWVTRRWASRC